MNAEHYQICEMLGARGYVRAVRNINVYRHHLVSPRLVSAPTRSNELPIQQIRRASTRNFNGQLSFKERFRSHWRSAKQDYPILLPVLLIGTITSISVLGLLIYDEVTRVSPQYAAYPEPVEAHLRQALRHVYVKPDPDTSEAYFTRALKAAEDCGMDPLSQPVIGIRTRLAEMLEKFGRAKAAIEVLQGAVKLCEDRIADIDRGVSKLDPEQTASQRRGLLTVVLRSKAKMANIFESDYMQDPIQAKHILSEAVGQLVKETKNPQVSGFSEDNGADLPLDEIASMLSQMGDLYATTGEEANAVQTYMLTLQPLRAACNGTRSCKEVQILSNIASTMDLAMKKPGATINGQPATKESLAAARRATLKWADQAIATAEVVTPENRDEVCELGRISAELTKADLLLEDGKQIQAREAFRSMLPILREKGLDSLVKTAEMGLQRAGG